MLQVFFGLFSARIQDVELVELGVATRVRNRSDLHSLPLTWDFTADLGGGVATAEHSGPINITGLGLGSTSSFKLMKMQNE
jgi:hypothetical protein